MIQRKIRREEKKITATSPTHIVREISVELSGATQSN